MIEQGVYNANKSSKSIKYQTCKNNKKHHNQVMNYVCLQSSCQQQALICSLCRNQKHLGHATQPLKFMVDCLRQQFYNKKTLSVGEQLQEIELLENMFYQELTKTVTSIAQQFQRLQQQMINYFDSLKDQCQQEQLRRKAFQEFQSSFYQQNSQMPQFLIQNYLPKLKLTPIKNFQCIKKLKKNISSLIEQTRQLLKEQSSKYDQEKFTKQQQIKQLKLTTSPSQITYPASSIEFLNNKFRQKNKKYTAPSLCVIKKDFKYNFKKNIEIKILELKKNSYLYVGLIQKKFYQSSNSVFPINPKKQLPENIKGKIVYLSNSGNFFGGDSSSIQCFTVYSLITAKCFNDQLCLQQNKKKTSFKIPNAGQFYFFFSLLGEIQVQVKGAIQPVINLGMI